jgi:hypothetical protein
MRLCRHGVLELPTADACCGKWCTRANHARLGQADVVLVAHFWCAELRPGLVDARGEHGRVAGLRAIGMQPALQPAVMRTDFLDARLWLDTKDAVGVGIGGREQDLLEIEACGVQHRLFALAQRFRRIAHSGWCPRCHFQYVRQAGGQRAFAQAEALARVALEGERGLEDTGCG